MKTPLTKKELTKALRNAGVMIRTKVPKSELEQKYNELVEQQANVKQAVEAVWEQIGEESLKLADEAGEAMTGTAAVEGCIDANRLSKFGYPDAEKQVQAQIERDGYDATLKALAATCHLPGTHAEAEQAKKKAKKKAAAKKSNGPKSGQSMAEFMDELVQRTADPDELKSALEQEAQRRGVKNPGLGGLRSHVRYRHARGQLTEVNLPAAK